MKHLASDLRYGFRLLWKSPLPTLTAVLALALGIGANLAIVSVTDALLLRPLPFPNADRLVQLEQDSKGKLVPAVAPAKFVAWHRGGRSFAGMAAFDLQARSYNLAAGGRPEVVSGYRVSADFFPVFSVAPQLGRAVSSFDDQPGAPPVAVLSAGLWRRRFGGDPSTVGRRVLLDGESYTVIGVMPPGFRYPQDADFWTALKLDPATRARARSLLVVARLAPGVPPAAARADLDAVNRRHLAEQGWAASDERLSVRPLQVFLHGDFRPVLLVLLAAVALVLVIACANVANLQLARSAVRQREVALRIALGAGPGRIVVQFLIESTLLALFGGLLGLFLCFAALKLFFTAAPPDLAARLPEIPIDSSLLAFALGLSIATGLLAGILPALQARRASLEEVLREGATGAGASGGRRAQRLRSGLVVLEVAIALMLSIGAGLLVRSFAGLVATDPGFAADDVLTLKLPLPASRYGQPGAMAELERRLLPQLAALPGVRGAALVNTLPTEPGGRMTFVIAGRYEPGSGDGVGVGAYRTVSPGFFATLGIRPLRGRTFAATDGAGSPGVLVLNETAARAYFPRGDALGQRILVGLPDMPAQADPAPREVIGVVRDVREGGLENAPPAILYVPLAQVPDGMAKLLVQRPLSLALRAGGPPSRLVRPAEERIWAFDPDLPITGVSALQGILSRSVGSQRFRTLLFGGFAALALLLAALGVYGVLAHLVSQRTREIGVRMALGGRPGDIVRLVLRQGMTAVLLGVVLGLCGARATVRLLAGYLYGVGTADPTTFVAVSGLMLAVALLAIYVPARRAAHVDPVEALRHG